MRLPRLGVLLLALWLGASSARAGPADEFQEVQRRTGLPGALWLSPGEPLTADKAKALWRGLLDSPATVQTFAPRTVLARLLNEALASAQPLAYAELRTRAERFRPLVLVRPDGHCVGALTGKTLARLGTPELREGELYVQRLRVGAFYFDTGGTFFAVDEALHKQGDPLGERPLEHDPATAALLGSQDAVEELARGLASLVAHPVRTLEGLSRLPSSVAGLIAASPEYFARYGAMTGEEQVREVARLATHLLTLQGGVATVGPRLAEASRLSVLTLSRQGAWAVHEVAVPAGAVTTVVGAGAASVSLLLMAQGPPSGTWTAPVGGPGQWTYKPESMSPEAQRFQTQVTGAPEGWVYRVRTGPGPKDYVDFDGFKNGVLLEVKGPGYEELLRRMQGKEWFEGEKAMIAQAKRQARAVSNHPIRWHFAESRVAKLVSKLFQENNLGHIEVVPPPASP